MFRSGKNSKDLVKAYVSETEICISRQVQYPNRPSRPSFEFARVTPQKFESMCETNQNLFEVIRSTRNVCAFFDVDKASFRLNHFFTVLHGVGITEAILLDSSDPSLPLPEDLDEYVWSFLRPKKTSYHIIVPSLVFNHIHSLKAWVLATILPKIDYETDTSIYSLDRLWRACQQTKVNSNRPLRNLGWFSCRTGRFVRRATFQETLVSTHNPPNIFFEPKKKPVVKIQSAPGNYLSLPRSACRSRWLNVCSALKSLGYTAEQVFQYDPSETHHRGLDDFKDQFSRMELKSNAKEYLDSFFALRNYPFKQFQEAFGLTTVHRKINQKYVSNLTFKKRVTMIRSYPGSGKSTLCRKVLKQFPGRKLIVVSSRALAYNTKENLEKLYCRWGEFNPFRLYLSTNRPISEGSWIITFQSLWRLQVFKDSQPFSVVIWDETESICSDACSKTTHKPLASQRAFKALQEQKPVQLCLDAFLSDKALDLFKFYNPGEVEVIVNNYQEKKTCYLYPEIRLHKKLNAAGQDFFSSMLSRVADGENIY